MNYIAALVAVTPSMEYHNVDNPQSISILLRYENRLIIRSQSFNGVWELVGIVRW